MTEAPASPDRLHADQIAFWSGEGGAIWLERDARIESRLKPLGDHALAAAAARPGERALDIGCGLGHATLALARAVGPEGQVLGADLSPDMIAEASRRAASAGLAQARFVAADASAHAFDPAAADLLFSRFGVMFFGRPEAAFANLRRGLKPGGRVALLVWRPVKENGWMFVPFMAATPHLPPMPRPNPGDPGPFSLADPDRARRVLGEAGFADASLDAVDETMSLSDGPLEDAVRTAIDIGPLARPLRQADAATRAKVADAIRAALAKHHTAQGVRLPAACWLVTARNPG